MIYKPQKEKKRDWAAFWLMTLAIATLSIIVTVYGHWHYGYLYGWGWGMSWLIGGTAFFGTWIPLIFLMATDKPDQEDYRT